MVAALAGHGVSATVSLTSGSGRDLVGHDHPPEPGLGVPTAVVSLPAATSPIL